MSEELGGERLVVVAGERVGRFVAEGPGGVGDVPAAPVELDAAGGLAPPAPSVRVVGRGAEGREEVAGRGLFVDVDVLVGEVDQLAGELAVFVPGGGDRVGGGERVELLLDLRELALEEGELVAVPFDAQGGLLPLGASSASGEPASELVELLFLAGDDGGEVSRCRR